MTSERAGDGFISASFPPLPEALPVDILDSHCHLDLLKVPVPQAVSAAHAVGIRRILTIGCDLKSSTWAAQTARENPDVYAGVAIHPNDTTGVSDDVLDDIAELAARPEVRAVGETGLDYYRDWAPKEDQHRSFRAHIDIAKRTGKPLMIHDREAHEDVLAVLEQEGAPERVVFHCFSGDAEMAKKCADRGYVMSFAGNVTFKNAEPLREALRVAPLELILVETDAPFLTPVPHRGKPNASYLIPLTVRFMAEVKGVDVAELCSAIAANGERLFGPW
ncbi:TatD family hydrolase [Thermomonospora curvata]|uniref:Hydrolase, TatD family n=1 Tax=Thermomonospora curvata (strain ATCC 19995 / DSM 43183 / JCM 3096 / KCTC 9072 / NBRC 15933 / NCIMB 10081 / Henssen B9) TaxID=471852 RepID=D1A7H7_THECD|nr:TatD family hydrolase [Thermomonospora curvata]ACY96566.1 hydrolase, TatD family [Thermomonospora curvata DSM 43183]